MAYRKVYEPSSEEYRDEAIADLKRWFPKGSEVTTLVRHVTQSGMGRSISVLAYEDGRIYDVSYRVARVLDLKIDVNYGGVYVRGAGMDMCFWLTYELSRKIYKDEAAAGDAGYLLKHVTI